MAHGILDEAYERLLTTGPELVGGLTNHGPMVVECLDPGFLRNVDGCGSLVHTLFLVLVVANLVAGFQALGTLMAVGLMMLPATAARFWAGEVWSLALAAALIAMLSGFVGLLLSFHAQWPSGPAIVLVAGVVYLLSLAAGPREGLLWRGLRRHRHRHRHRTA